MGYTNDPMAVVDKFTKVIGVEKLRVVDSSIFPQITNGNLNGPTIMVGEKASDHILGKDRCLVLMKLLGSIHNGKLSSDSVLKLCLTGKFVITFYYVESAQKA